jgi:protein tyrosine phosphatase (PTP) superfamily phosphohydrolase (DUF442 family)
MRVVIGVVAVTSVAVTVWLGWETQRNRLVWDHFDVVKPGILYRSGQLNPDQLAAAVRRYGLRTIISFQVPGHEVEAERALARQLRVDFLNLPMPGDGSGRAEQFREVVAACDDPNRRPVLIHCARGTCRTGAAVAFYRLARDGWTMHDIAAEMTRQAYRDGWLPGYVFGMVDDKPQRALYDYPNIYDHNLPTPPSQAERDRAEGLPDIFEGRPLPSLVPAAAEAGAVEDFLSPPPAPEESPDGP